MPATRALLGARPDIPASNRVEIIMTIEIPNTELPANVADGEKAAEVVVDMPRSANSKRSPEVGASPARTKTARHGKKSKKDQLVALLSKPNGARISVIVERLGWQAHTVRAALSGLRKQGFEIKTAKSKKTGETVYSIVVRQNGRNGQINEAAS